ncbi:MAG: hypothetical protein C3F02_02420 [Parcubacteria group bacterium]|nr:MAG: hypothetical protein C3F02_02420 [Parcubacteria group bacterium]
MPRATLAKTLKKLQRYNRYFAVGFVFSLLITLFLTTSYANNQNLMRHQLSLDVQTISDEYLLLNTQATQLQTAQRIETESKRLNLVKVQSEDITYLGNPDKTVALRD